MKKEYATAIVDPHASDDTSAAGPTRYYEDEDHHSRTMEKESQPQQQQQEQEREQQQEQHQEQEQELHPYMCLYEPLLFATEPAGVEVGPSSSSSSSPPPSSPPPSSPQKQPEATSSSYAVAKRSPPSLPSRINTTTRIYRTRARAKKRKKLSTTATTTTTTITTTAAAAATPKIDSSDSNILEKHKNFNSRWEEMYQRLVAYKREHNSTKVPSRYKKDPKLGQWVTFQRTTHKSKKLTHKRKRRLDSIDFSWAVAGKPFNVHYDAQWEGMYQRLVAYKKENKNTTVPRNNNEDSQLGRWVSKQRFRYKNNMLTEERTRLLNSSGFIWVKARGKSNSNHYDERWREMYQRLVAYNEEHKNTMVPRSYRDPQLSVWVIKQRIKYRGKEMREERVRLLDSIGFLWEVTGKINMYHLDIRWEEMYQRLIAYKKEHNDMKIPHRCKEDPKLGRWVGRQRAGYRHKEMNAERKRLLNSIGFDWGET